jgi:hypothetical protein
MDSLVSGIIDCNQAALMSRVQFSVAGKMLQNQRMQGAAIVKLIQSAETNATSAGDSLTVAATGLGAQMDVYG